MPNIHGYFSGGLTNYLSTAEAFKRVSWGNSDKTGRDGYGWTGIEFSAEWSNAIYGASDTVQPPAVRVYVWIRES